jgi:hypothetical protein
MFFWGGISYLNKKKKKKKKHITYPYQGSVTLTQLTGQAGYGMLVAHRGRSVAPFAVSDCKQRTSGTEAGRNCSGIAPKWHQNGLRMASILLFQAIRQVTMIVIFTLQNRWQYVVDVKSYELLNTTDDGFRKVYIVFPDGKFDILNTRGFYEVQPNTPQPKLGTYPPAKAWPLTSYSE